MSDESKRKDAPNPVKSIFHEYRGEFRKIVWPNREETFKHTVTVIAVSLIFGAYIALTDFGFGQLYSLFMQLVRG